MVLSDLSMSSTTCQGTERRRFCPYLPHHLEYPPLVLPPPATSMYPQRTCVTSPLLVAVFSLVASGIPKPQQAAKPGRKRRIGGAPGDVRPQHRTAAAGTRAVGPEKLPPRQRHQQESVRSGRRTGGACPGERRSCHRLQCLGGPFGQDLAAVHLRVRDPQRHVFVRLSGVASRYTAGVADVAEFLRPRPTFW